MKFEDKYITTLYSVISQGRMRNHVTRTRRTCEWHLYAMCQVIYFGTQYAEAKPRSRFTLSSLPTWVWQVLQPLLQPMIMKAEWIRKMNKTSRCWLLKYIWYRSVFFIHHVIFF